eukprot:gene4236-5217_t
MACMLPFPDRFEFAVKFMNALPDEQQGRSNETRLILFSLHKQATEGECKTPIPWFGNPVEKAKLTTWTSLGNMDKFEAMRLYAKIVEEEHPKWWEQVDTAETETNKRISPAPAPRPAPAPGPLPVGLATISDTDGWLAPCFAGIRPRARYQHSAAISAHKMFVVGGNNGGRYFSDMQVLDLDSMTWAKAETLGASTSASALAPCAGHKLVTWNGAVLLVGGHVKKDTKHDSLTVLELDAENYTWKEIETTGSKPLPRGGHSATVFGDLLVVFGGEGAGRQVLNELHILDLNTNTWSSPSMNGLLPAPRSDHAATAFDGRYLCIFGGGSCTRCHADLHLLDMETMTWSTPACLGQLPSARAGHASALVDGDKWYIVGGGNGAAGCTATLLLELRSMSWSTVCTSALRTAVSSEGLSLVAVGEYLISYGGYNGKYNNDTHVFKTGVLTATSAAPEPAASPAPAALSAPAASPAPAATPAPPKPALSGDAAEKEAAAKARQQQVAEAERRAETDKANIAGLAAAISRAEAAEALLAVAEKEKSVLSMKLVNTKECLSNIENVLSDSNSKTLRLELEVEGRHLILGSFDPGYEMPNRRAMQIHDAHTLKTKQSYGNYSNLRTPVK